MVWFGRSLNSGLRKIKIKKRLIDFVVFKHMNSVVGMQRNSEEGGNVGLSNGGGFIGRDHHVPSTHEDGRAIRIVVPAAMLDQIKDCPTEITDDIINDMVDNIVKITNKATEAPTDNIPLINEAIEKINDGLARNVSSRILSVSMTLANESVDKKALAFSELHENILNKEHEDWKETIFREINEHEKKPFGLREYETKDTKELEKEWEAITGKSHVELVKKKRLHRVSIMEEENNEKRRLEARYRDVKMSDERTFRKNLLVKLCFALKEATGRITLRGRILLSELLNKNHGVHYAIFTYDEISDHIYDLIAENTDRSKNLEIIQDLNFYANTGLSLDTLRERMTTYFRRRQANNHLNADQVDNLNYLFSTHTTVYMNFPHPRPVGHYTPPGPMPAPEGAQSRGGEHDDADTMISLTKEAEEAQDLYYTRTMRNLLYHSAGEEATRQTAGPSGNNHNTEPSGPTMRTSLLPVLERLADTLYTMRLSAL